MLFKLAFNNMKKGIKDYAIYFLTLVIGVAIFYMFNSLESQQAMLEISESQQQLVQTLIMLLEIVSVFVAIILGLLIVYANNFLISRRKKEFGIYMTLGMSKWKMSKIVFLETIFVGLFSLIVGLLIGILLSQFMTIFVASLFESDLTEYHFIFSKESCIKTCCYFAIMYLVVILLNMLVVSRYKLINLLNASKKNEKIKMKNPIISIILCIIGATILGYAYNYVISDDINAMNAGSELLQPILLGCIGTILVVWSLSGLVIAIVQKIKGIYLKGTNMFVLRQINNKINTNVISISVICIMLFVTITVLSSSLALRTSMQKELVEVTPMDVMLLKELKTTKLSNAEKEKNIQDNLIENGFDMNDLKDIIEVPMYSTADVTLEDFIGNNIEEIKEAFPEQQYGKAEQIMKISDYNKIASKYGIEQYTLEDDEYIMTCDFVNMEKMRNIALEDGNNTITINGKEYNSKYNECKYGFVAMSTGYSNDGLILVPDNVELTDENKLRTILVANYNTSTSEEKQKIEEKFANTNSDFVKNLYYNNGISIATKIQLMDASVGVSTVIVFIAIYLGIVFLIASVAILALKQLTESSDNRKRYRILRKIGCDEKKINMTLFKQIGIFFTLPLVLAIIHSIFGIKFALTMMSGLASSEDLLPSIITTTIIMGIIYIIYFIATYLGSKNIIKERTREL